VECKNAKQLAVIKQIDISQLNEQKRKDTLKEAKILEVLSRHPNIVTFKEVYKTKQGRLCIVMEYIDGGDLNQKSAEKVA
jgi:NIMA (never in mitosis gene a)-related kinase 1/4/5